VDCIPDVEKSGLLCRQEHLGFDRHGRKYWFLARRIFVYVHLYISVILFASN
jgi:nucleosome-remodeling factor subunit BPTF